MQGSVKSVSQSYLFIRPDNQERDERDVFCHISASRELREKWLDIAPGDRLEFDIVPSNPSSTLRFINSLIGNSD